MASPSPEELHAPYPPKTASLGLVPTVGVDVPICAVLMLFFIGGAVGHMTIFQANKRKGHKFILSAMTFGFCMARNVTMIMRIVWACYPTDIQIAIAAQIFVSAGVLILFIVNLVFSQRILRATHPHIGWHKTLKLAYAIVYGLILLMLAVLITATVQSFYTLNPNTHRIDRDLQLAGSTYFMSIAFLPLVNAALSLLLPRKSEPEQFGKGRFRTKILVLVTSAVLLTLGAAFRTGTTYKNPRPRNDPAWYQQKWCFYFFNFVVEILVIYLYLALRVDQRFHVPNGSKGPGDYSRSQQEKEQDDGEARPSVDSGRPIVSDDSFLEEKLDSRRASTSGNEQ